MTDLTVRKLSCYAMVPMDTDGTPLHKGERMTEVSPGQWMTPPAAAALALFAEAEDLDGHRIGTVHAE